MGQLIGVYGLRLERLLISLLDAAHKGIEHFIRSGTLGYPAQYRLAFRELGLCIGLHGLKIVRQILDEWKEEFEQKDTINEVLLRLHRYMPLYEVLKHALT